jgi:hypothetical protein
MEIERIRLVRTRHGNTGLVTIKKGEASASPFKPSILRSLLHQYHFLLLHVAIHSQLVHVGTGRKM